jgi:hypothetical protein
MFYVLKHLLLLNLIIFKLKCNNLIVNEIMVLNTLYVCLLHSHFIEDHPIWILEDGPLISEVVLSHQGLHHHDYHGTHQYHRWLLPFHVRCCLVPSTIGCYLMHLLLFHRVWFRLSSYPQNHSPTSAHKSFQACSIVHCSCTSYTIFLFYSYIKCVSWLLRQTEWLV